MLTSPWSLRFQLARDPALCRAVRRTFLRALFGDYARRAARADLLDARTGAVNVAALRQRLELLVLSNRRGHFHALVLDGVHHCASPWADPVFHPLASPTDEDVARLCRTVRDSRVRLLQRRGLLDAAPASATDDEPPLLEPIHAASIADRVALGERAGRALTQIDMRPGREVAYVPGGLCAQIDGFSLHARVRVPPGDRDRLEHLCR